MLNCNQEHPTMKKHLKIPSLLIERAKLQFKTFNLRNSLKLPPFELNKYHFMNFQISLN